MKAEDYIHQAYAFTDWHERAGGDLKRQFLMWARSKDFSPSDGQAIFHLIEQEAPVLVKVWEEAVCSSD